MSKEKTEMEADSMKATVMERNGYKRLDFGTLNFADDHEISEINTEDIAPILWTKDVLSGEKNIIIKKQ